MPHSPLLLQLVVILGTARLLSLLLRRFGQPPVIGEMLAGLALGPILLGNLAPDFHAHLFARDSLAPLGALSQIGLVLFMFIVGAELRMPSGVRQRIVAASWVGVLSVLMPMGLGLALAPLLHPQLAPANVKFWPFASFIASSLAITAFPIMARILKDRGQMSTAVGQLSLTSAAIADVLAWIALALVVALISSESSWNGIVLTIGGLIALAAFAFGLVRPLLAATLARHADDGRPDGMVLATLLIVTFAFAAVTEWLSLHAVFGAFLFGACLPRDDRLLHTLVERLEHVAVLVLLPVFFAMAGLNTTTDAFAGAGIGVLCMIVIVAVSGKVFGGAIGARIGGMGWRDSLAVGSLMNARGLMELIVLKVGLDVGVIGKELFTMLMVMAIVTTVMTTPLLSLLTRPRRNGEPDAGLLKLPGN